MRRASGGYCEVERPMTDRALLIAGMVSAVLCVLFLSQVDYPFPEAPDWQVSAK